MGRVAPAPVGALAVRLGAIAGLLGAAVAMDLGGAYPLSGTQLNALYGIAAAGFAAALVAAIATVRNSVRFPLPIELATDFVLALSLVCCTGGARSPFSFVFVVWIVYATTRAGPHAAASSASLSTLALGGIVLGGVTGWIGGFQGGGTLSPPEAFRIFGLYTVAFAAIGLLSHRLAREVSSGRTKLRELGEIHRRIFDSVSSGLMTVSPDGTISSFNREAEKITGFQQSEVWGSDAGCVFPVLAETIRKARDGSADLAQSRLEVTLESRSGKFRQLGLSCAVLRDEHGADAGSVLIFQDLTGVLAMQEELQRSERLAAVGQLAAGLAHEIRNPLASLWGSMELLRDELPELRPEQKQLLEIVERETARLNALLEDFLSYARPGSARRERVSLCELLTEIRDLACCNVELRTRVDLDLAPDLYLLGDPTQLRSVFWNLVLNAMQAEPVDGRVRIRAALEAGGRDSGRSLLVEVEDRGQGIQNALLERIFEPFFTTRPKGSGLGLATVHRLVELHGGSLAVESAEGAGTTVRVSLPAAPD